MRAKGWTKPLPPTTAGPYSTGRAWPGDPHGMEMGVLIWTSLRFLTPESGLIFTIYQPSNNDVSILAH